MNTTNLSITELQKSCELLLLKVSELSHQNQHLQEQIEWFKRQLFGRKSERVIEDNGQLYFPGFQEMCSQTPPEKKTITVPAHEKRKGKSTAINTISYPEDLPVETIVLDLSDKDKIDPVTGQSLICIGEDVSRKLAKKPSHYFIKETIRKKYATPGSPDQGIKTADLPASLMLRSAVDESIVADVLTQKFCDHLPLYRQVEILARNQIRISRQTLSSYVMESAKALKPLYELLKQEIKASGNVFIDETPVDVLAPGTGKTDTGYMVTLVGGQSLNPSLRAYEFFTSRKHQGFEELLKDYQGVFHSDKYGAYEKIAKREGMIWMPCFAHIRRKYVEAEAGDPKFREEILRLMRRLFDVEERGKDLLPEERVCLRKEEAIPIIDELIAKNKERLTRGLLPKSKLTTAIGYFLSLSPYLKNYIENPFARIDNNVAERALKLVVIGRKNWLFIGSEGGGEASAILYSLAQTCRAVGINPHTYFNDVLRKIQEYPYRRLIDLLPHNWKET